MSITVTLGEATEDGQVSVEVSGRIISGREYFAFTGDGALETYDADGLQVLIGPVRAYFADNEAPMVMGLRYAPEKRELFVPVVGPSLRMHPQSASTLERCFRRWLVLST